MNGELALAECLAHRVLAVDDFLNLVPELVGRPLEALIANRASLTSTSVSSGDAFTALGISGDHRGRQEEHGRTGVDQFAMNETSAYGLDVTYVRAIGHAQVAVRDSVSVFKTGRPTKSKALHHNSFRFE